MTEQRRIIHTSLYELPLDASRGAYKPITMIIDGNTYRSMTRWPGTCRTKLEAAREAERQYLANDCPIG